MVNVAHAVEVAENDFHGALEFKAVLLRHRLRGFLHRAVGSFGSRQPLLTL
jgi:hypothetical protein